jgi:CheY-like chemotaxis protein
MARALGVSPRRVLVVDDDLDVALTLAQALRVCGCTVDVANGGAEGLEKARATRPDLVFCDLAMPGMDGRAVAAALRADPELKRVRLIAFTGNPEFGYAAARAAGFDDLLQKPGGLARVADVLERSSAA